MWLWTPILFVGYSECPIVSLTLHASDWRSSYSQICWGCVSCQCLAEIGVKHSLSTSTKPCFCWLWHQERLTSMTQSPRQSFILPKSVSTDQYKWPELTFHHCNPRKCLLWGSGTSSVSPVFFLNFIYPHVHNTQVGTPTHTHVDTHPHTHM